MPQDDTWDWPLLLYVGTVFLKRTEKQFWTMTPRKFRALTDAHIELNSDKQKGNKQKTNGTGFIDQVI